jgi:hypothetical protein
MKPYVLGQFASSAKFLEAARTLRSRGHEDVDGYSPYPIHGFEEAFGVPRSRVPLLCLCGGLSGASIGYLMQWWCNAVDFPINVGGRPFHSFWQNIPITFELGVLLGALSIFFGLFALLRLPQLHHPVFDIAAFRSASIDRYWISVRAEDVEKARADLAGCGADSVSVVEDRA